VRFTPLSRCWRPELHDQRPDPQRGADVHSDDLGSTNIGTAPILSSYWAICHPDVAYDVAGITGFTSVEKYGQQTATVVEGEFGYYSRAGRGVRFVMSEDSSVDANAGAALSGADLRSTARVGIDIYTICIYGQNAFGSVGLGKKQTDGAYRAGDNTGGWEVIGRFPCARSVRCGRSAERNRDDWLEGLVRRCRAQQGHCVEAYRPDARHESEAPWRTKRCLMPSMKS
jgi:hypothetical protein